MLVVSYLDAGHRAVYHDRRGRRQNMEAKIEHTH